MKQLAHPPLNCSGRRRASHGRGRPVPAAPPLIPYRVFITYASVPAARQALARVNALVRARGAGFILQPMLWRCDQLDSPRWREVALRDAASAELLVLAFADAAPISANTEAWLTQLAARMRGAQVTALAFVGDDEGWTISLRAAPLAQAARAVVPPPQIHAAPSPRARVEKIEAVRAA